MAPPQWHECVCFGELRVHVAHKGCGGLWCREELYEVGKSSRWRPLKPLALCKQSELCYYKRGAAGVDINALVWRLTHAGTWVFVYVCVCQ